MSETTMTLKVVVEKEVTVKYEHTPACRGYRNSLGVPEEPDEEESVEIESVCDENGNELETVDDISDIEERLLKDLKGGDR